MTTNSDRRKDMREAWMKQRDLGRQVTDGPWAAWALTNSTRNPDQKRRVTRKLAEALGFDEIPNGKINIGWCVEQLLGASHSSQRPSGTGAAVTALTWLRARQNGGVSSSAGLVFSLMFHREYLAQFNENAFTYYDREGKKLRLYGDKWNDLNEVMLEWAMMHSPLHDLDQPSDEVIRRIHTNDAGRIHNTSGAALVTTEGRAIYALNGIALDTPSWEARGRASAILKIVNSERQRVLIEDMGTELFIQEAGMHPIHKDETGMLYKLESQSTSKWTRDREHMCWVHVTCPSTDREYMLAVPPMTRTAREGVAWTFRKLPEEYNPSVQT